MTFYAEKQVFLNVFSFRRLISYQANFDSIISFSDENIKKKF